VFGLVMLLAATVLVAVARRGRRAVLTGVSAFAAVLLALVINLAPTVVYAIGHGSNAQLQHEAGVGDDLAMSASYLILPPLHDRVAPLRHLTEHYAVSTPPHGYCEQCYESIGTVGDVGFLWLGLAALAAALGAPLLARRRSTQLRAAAGIAVCLAVAVTGGISSLTRVFVTADIRAWNRLSVLIAFFSLLAVGLLLDALRVQLRGRRASLAFGLIVAVVLLIGVGDQTSRFFVPDYTRDARQYHSDGRFAAAIQRGLPAGASIFQLPYVPFPEGYQPFAAPGQTNPYAYPLGFEYEALRPYLQSSGLRWSYGATKGRAADWAAQLAAQPVSAAVAGAAAAGFDGIEVDLSGYPGALGDRLRHQLRSLLGVAPLTSPARDLLFYDLRPYAARLRASDPVAAIAALRSAVLDPLRLNCSTGRLTIVNPGTTAREAAVEATATATQPTAMRLDLGRNATRVVTATPRGTRIRQTARLAPGTTTISMSARDPRAHSVSLQSPSVVDSAVASFVQGGSGTVPLGIVGPPCATVGVSSER
jgi:phosphoglycerol transferase